MTRTTGSRCSGVELTEACPKVSSAAQDKSSLTSMVMLTCPSALRGQALMGPVVRMGDQWPPKGGTLGSWPFPVDCKMSTSRGVGLPPSRVVPLASDSGKDVITGT